MRKFKISRQKRRDLLIAMMIVLIICLGSILEINMFYKGFNAFPKKADAIIVTGCAVWGTVPSPALYERIYKAYELYKEGYSKKIIASGGKGEGENLSEAAAIKRQLKELGVRPQDIIEENISTNTYENLLFSKAIMKEREFKSCIIITNYFHIYRCSLIAKDLNLKASYGRAKMPESFSFLITSNIREVLSLIRFFYLQVYEGIQEIFVPSLS